MDLKSKHQISNTKHQWNEFCNLKFGVWNLEFDHWNLKHGI